MRPLARALVRGSWRCRAVLSRAVRQRGLHTSASSRCSVKLLDANPDHESAAALALPRVGRVCTGLTGSPAGGWGRHCPVYSVQRAVDAAHHGVTTGNPASSPSRPPSPFPCCVPGARTSCSWSQQHSEIWLGWRRKVGRAQERLVHAMLARRSVHDPPTVGAPQAHRSHALAKGVLVVRRSLNFQSSAQAR